MMMFIFYTKATQPALWFTVRTSGYYISLLFVLFLFVFFVRAIFVHGLNRYGVNIVEKKVPIKVSGNLTKKVGERKVI